MITACEEFQENMSLGANYWRSLKIYADGLLGILIENLSAGNFFSIAFFNNDENKSFKIMHMFQIRF